MNISIRLKQARENKELSLSELSNLTGIAKSTLQRYETGSTKKIPMDAISIIEQALNLPVGYLMGWEDNSGESTSSKDITFDDFTYAMYEETKDLTEEDKEALLSMARLLKKKSEQ